MKSDIPPMVYMTLGLPGAGKTFFARHFTGSQGIALISADKMRYVMNEEPTYNKKEDADVMQIMDYMAEEFLRAGVSIMLDGLNSSRARRHAVRQLARKYKATPLVIWVQTDADTCFDRAANRDRRHADDKYNTSIDEKTFDTLADAVKAPEIEDYVVISGKHVPINQANAVRRKLHQLASSKQSLGKPVSLGGRVDLSRRKQGRGRFI